MSFRGQGGQTSLGPRFRQRSRRVIAAVVEAVVSGSTSGGAEGPEGAEGAEGSRGLTAAAAAGPASFVGPGCSRAAESLGRPTFAAVAAYGSASLARPARRHRGAGSRGTLEAPRRGRGQDRNIFLSLFLVIAERRRAHFVGVGSSVLANLVEAGCGQAESTAQPGPSGAGSNDACDERHAGVGPRLAAPSSPKPSRRLGRQRAAVPAVRAVWH